MTHDPSARPQGEEAQSSLARSASILSLGNVASRALGLARETVIADLFGASGAVSAFRLASRVPTMVYDLLVGGMLSAAIVPVLSDLARPNRRDELWQAASAVLSLLVILLGGVVIAIELLAQPLASLLGSGLEPELQAITARSLRILAPTILVFGSAGFLTALLYALRRFTFPAIAAASFNLGIIVAAPLLAGHIGIDSLSVGILGGSLVQLLIQLPGLRDSHIRLRWNLRHPAVRRIGKLYLPVAIGLVVGQVQVLIDGNLATRTGESSGGLDAGGHNAQGVSAGSGKPGGVAGSSADAFPICCRSRLGEIQAHIGQGYQAGGGTHAASDCGAGSAGTAPCGSRIRAR